MNLSRDALRRISVRLVLLQCFGHLLLLAAGLLWLRIPDSHVWELVLSVAVGAVIVAAFLALYAYTAQSIRRPSERQRLWLGSLILLVWFALAAFALRLAGHLGDHISERAGFWNSRFGPSLRTVVTYNRLVTWQQDAITILLWIVLPALILPGVVESVANRRWTNYLASVFAVIRNWRHWIAAALAGGLLLWITPRLVNWHPLDSVSGELVSAALRLPLVFFVDLALVMFLLAVDAELLARYHARRYAATEPSTNDL